MNEQKRIGDQENKSKILKLLSFKNQMQREKFQKQLEKKKKKSYYFQRRNKGVTTRQIADFAVETKPKSHKITANFTFYFQRKISKNEE